MADDIVYDEMLGELRTSDVSGGTGGGGGGDYIAGTGINSVALEGGTIAVTGLTAAVSGSTATIKLKNTADGVPVVGQDGVLVQGNTNGEVEFGVPAVSKHAVFSNSAATLAANTELVAVQNCDNMKNDYITFFANFETFDTLTISHLLSTYGWGKKIIITETEIGVYDRQDNHTISYQHGLTLSEFVSVLIQNENTNTIRSNITLRTSGGSFTVPDSFFYGDIGPVSAVATAAMTNASLNYVVTDAICPVWVFGDSYVSFMSSTKSWAYQFVENKHTGVLFCGHSGSNSSNMWLSFQNLVSKAIPRYVVWDVGMNDADSSSSIDASWKTVADSLIATCEALGITLIFCTIPNTPKKNHTFKNAYIKASGLRYVDFAHAVNADAAGATWYTGMLNSDNVHPTELGANTLMNQFILDCPESILLMNDNQLPVIPGNRIELINGCTVAQSVWFPVTTVTDNWVQVRPGNAYIVNASTSNFYIFAPAYFPDGYYGLESHLEIFVGKTAYVIAKDNVVLVNSLIPDSINNCLIRFHDGKAIVSVEDHIGGYVVVSATGDTSGTLPYGLSSSTQTYIVFDATTDGAECNMSGAVTNGSKHIVGNGYTSTTLTGTINITSKTTVVNLGLNNVTVSSGTISLDDAYIPNGGRLTVGSGGGIELHKANGGGTIDLGGTRITAISGETITASGLTFTNGIGPGGGAVGVNGRACEFVSCIFSGNVASAGGGGGAIYTAYNANARFVSCTITGNTSTNGGGCFCDQGVFSGCTISGNTYSDIRFTDSRAVVSAVDCTIGLASTSRGKLYLAGSNHIGQIAGASATTLIAEGAIVDITGAAATNTINPGGGIVVSGTGCTVINSGGTSVSITGGTYATIKKDGTTA